MSEERRSGPRIRVYRPVQLYKVGALPWVETLTKDLSLGGIRCLTPTLFPVSTELSLELTLSTGEEPIIARGRSIWFRTIPESEQFELGVDFLDLSPQNKRRLSGYLERLSRHANHVFSP